MRKNIILISVLAIFLSLIFVSCVTGDKIKNQIAVEHQRLKVDASRGAKLCVPYELAKAENELLIAEQELEAGNYSKANDHMMKESQYAVFTTKMADSCIPKDKDKDGIIDDVDKCPLQPGTKEFDGCPDTDGDKIIDNLDKCPRVPGIASLHGCPPAKDTDKDGIPDKLDRCPFDKEDFDNFQDADGCPDRDNDLDGVLDELDKCPNVKGPQTNQGCPVNDRDNDGIPDEVDKCPNQPEDKDNFQDNDGCPDPDNDQDGILDKDDRCPNDKGLKKNFGCPILDTDKDGIPDVVDKCPNQPEDKDNFEDADGCPDPDNDKDGILDKDDKCPNVAGLKEFFGCPDTDKDGIQDSLDKCPKVAGLKEFFGCPDTDKDGIQDSLDKCPTVPGVKENNGCPAKKKYKLIVVTAKKIELKQKVFFRSGRAVISRKSYELLKEVADAIKNSPRIKKVIIGGHTDSRGSRRFNLRLSQKRAEAVLDFLVDEGVDSSKLEAKGFGPDKPIASNRTRRGRAKNRRVEFKIIQ